VLGNEGLDSDSEVVAVMALIVQNHQLCMLRHDDLLTAASTRLYTCTGDSCKVRVCTADGARFGQLKPGLTDTFVV
jgi:hypothetical protein